MRIVIVNGYPGSGKTQFEDYCQDYLHSYCFRFSSVDLVKHIYKECGWNGEKTLEARKVLSDLKQMLYQMGLLEKHLDYKINNCYATAMKMGLELDKCAIFIAIREPEQIKMIKDNYKDVDVVLIERPSIGVPKTSNESDAAVMNFDYDYVISNDGTLEDLKQKAIEFCNRNKKEL